MPLILHNQREKILFPIKLLVLIKKSVQIMKNLTCQARGSKQGCMCIGIYLLVSGIFVLVLKQNKINNNLNIAKSDTTRNNHQGTVNSTSNVMSLEDISGKVQEIHQENKDQNRSMPCFSPYYIPLEDPLKSSLQAKHMLSYFNINSKYIVSVPRWLKGLTNQKSTNDKKYFIAAVLRVRIYAEDKAKWTIRELKQWLHYQFWAGAEHVYMCDHFLNKSEKVDPYLREYVNRGLVTLFDWDAIRSVPGSSTYTDDNIKNQCSCYQHVLEHFRDNAEWFYNFDMDENPFAPNDKCEGFLTRYLLKLKPGVSELRLANFVFEGQGDRSRDLVYDRLNRITTKPLNGNVKPIYRASMTTEAGMHGCKTTGVLLHPEHNSLIFVHYWGARSQKWGQDTEVMRKRTVVFNDVRNTIAVNIRHSLIAFGDNDAFASKTGP